jgi:hypothetical protein
LQRHGSACGSGEIRFYSYIQAPEKLTTAKEIAWRDRSISKDITCIESILADLKEYRQALAARYSELETMLYKEKIKLERYPHYKGRIEYFVTVTRQYEDGTGREELREVFTGKERKAAFSRFEELKKQRPGIEVIKDIEPRSWEK